MLKTTSRTAVILALILSAAIIHAADTANELKLQQAIDLLESKGDLARATPIFEQVSRSSDHALAARALLYLGGVQERQGREAAQATYERVLKEFGNQDAASQARKRLAALGVTPSDNVAFSRLIEVADDGGSVSSDGLSMAVIDWDASGDIAIQDTATGKLRRLLAKPVSDDDDWEAYGEWAALSPDQSKVLFFWDPLEKDVDYQLRVMANKPGSAPTVLFQTNKEITWIDSGVWFPDGQSVLLETQTSNRDWQLARLRLSDKEKSLKVIKPLGWRLQGVRGRPSISPDGQYIAYAALANNPSKKPAGGGVRPTAPDSQDQYIYVVPVDGSGPEAVVARSAGINESPVWTADGSHILFVSDRSIGNRTGAFGLWSVEVANGKALGAPEPVAQEMGRVRPVGVTRSGSYYFVRGQSGVDVFTADLQPGGAKLKRSPTRLTESAADVNSSPTWSPDGKKVAFKRLRPQNVNGQGSPNARVFDLVIRTIESGEEDVYSYANVTDSPPVWFHDGEHLLTLAGNQLLRLDLKTRLFRSIEAMLHSALPTGIVSVALSPNDETLYLATNEPRREAAKIVGMKVEIVSFSTLTGDTKRIYSSVSLNGMQNLSLSPDGRSLAVILQPEGAKTSRLARVDVGGNGKLIDLGPASGGVLKWTKDQRILFRTNDATKQNSLALIPATGGNPEYTGLDAGQSFRSLDLSPDGSRIVFSAGTDAEELWRIENVSSLWRNVR